MGIERISEFWPSWKPLELLGKGGNGEVYKCVHEEMGVKTYSAIKVINVSAKQMTTFTFDTGSIRSFCQNLISDCVNEINVMLSLKSCPNIVAIEDFKVVETEKDEAWEIFIRMELLTCLTDYLRDRVLTQAEVVKLGVDLCSALELCHSRNIMHRDIKPANIFVNELGDFKLGDFGIARTLEMATAGFSQKGTLTYVAPEVMYSNNYTTAVDIYSLGLVLYQLANNNRLPFVPATGDYTHTIQSEALQNRLKGETFPPACNADESLNSIFRIACEFEPKNRFQSAGQMREVLRSIVFTDRTNFAKPKFIEDERTTVVKTSEKSKYIAPDSVKVNLNLSKSEEYQAEICTSAGKVPNKLPVGIKISAILVVLFLVLLVGIPFFMYISDNEYNQNSDYYKEESYHDHNFEHKEEENTVIYNYHVGYDTPEHAGIVARSESTYYSDKIAVLAEGTPVRVISGFAAGTEYIKIAFESDGIEKNGWVLGKYIVDRYNILYDEQFNKSIAFEQKQANVYVSNITESGINEFEGTPSVDEMLRFALNHSVLNYKPTVSGIENGMYNLDNNFYEIRIDADYVDRLAVRFFGKDLNTADMRRKDVNDGHLYGYSSGVGSNGVGFVKSVYSDSAGEKYKIHFTVYFTGDADESEYYSYTPSQAEFFNTFIYSYDGYVVLQKYKSSGEDAYKIIEFKKATL